MNNNEAITKSATTLATSAAMYLIAAHAGNPATFRHAFVADLAAFNHLVFRPTRAGFFPITNHVADLFAADKTDDEIIASTVSFIMN